MTAKMRVLINGIKIKIKRGEALENILSSYIKVTDVEKNKIRESILGTD